MTPSVSDMIAARAAAAAVPVDGPLAESLARYVGLLSRWNRRINLTSFDLDHPDSAAIDRLVIESLRAVRHVPTGPLTVVDVGSGGGSPAIPLNLARPDLRMTLVEVRERKSAFLREAGRALGLTSLLVETQAFEAFCETTVLRGHVDLVTMRAVRPDRALWSAAAALLKPGGQFLWFVGFGETTEIDFSPLVPTGYEEPLMLLKSQDSSVTY